MIPLEQLCAAHHGAELLMLRSGGEQQQQGQKLSKEDSQGGESEGATTTSTRRKSTSTTTSILFEESSVTTPTTLVDDKSSSSNLVDTPSQPTSQPKHADSSTVNNNNAAHQASSSSLSSSQRRKSSSTSSTTSPLLPSQSTKILCPFGPDCRFVHVCREELRARLLRLPHNKEEKPQPLDDIRKGQQNNAGGGSSGDNNETSAINNSVVIGSAVSARHSSAFDSEYEKVAEVDFTLMTPATPHNFAGKHFHSTSAAQAASPVTVATPQRHGGQSANTRTASVPAAGISLRVVIDDTPIVPMTSEGGPGVQSSGRDDSYHASTALPQYFQNHHQHHQHQDHCHNEGGGGAGPTPPFPYPHHNGLDSPGEFPPNFLNQHHYQFPMAAVSASVVGDLTSPDSAYLQPTHHQHQLRGSPTPQSHNPYLRGASSISPKGVGVTSQLQHQQSWMSQSFPSLSASDHHVRSSSLAAAGATNVTIVDDRHAVLSPGMLPPTPGRGGAQALMDESLTSPTGWASRSQQHQSRHVQQPASQPPAASLYRSDSDTASLFLSRTGGSGGSGGGDAMTPIGRAVGGCNQLSHPASSSSLFVRGDGSRVGAIMMATPSPRAASASSLSSTPVFGSGEDFVSGAGGAPSTAAAAAAPSSFGEDNTQKSSLLPFSGSHSYRPGSAISVTTTTDSPVTVVLSTKPSKHAASQLWLKRMNSAVASITTSPQTGKDIDMDSHAGSTFLRGGSGGFGGGGGGFTHRRSPREPPALLFASASVEELSLSTVPLQHHHRQHALGHQHHVQHQQHDAQSGFVQSGHQSYQRRASSHQSAGASRRASSATSSVASINLDADDASGAVARRFNEVTAAIQHTTRNPQSTSSATTTFLLDGDELQ
ncbi:Hypothetical protein, putative [Bodo saltans]|uniref:Uncharacterized protein n=1 Tax=Bodo saltans TaxID=75058 RepID=A0A0S4J8K9_BODSA|nr:Hypothetical protein, putative [Bodo saltans]|eukprot:CUG86442.1 Hypothetical protein, putative [Bodo saltans]